jgi:glutamyl-tRNA synthetase
MSVDVNVDVRIQSVSRVFATMISAAAPMSLTSVVGRLAPSPTGGLHLGHARTFLVAWLAARSAGGRVIFRLEDLDSARVRQEASASAIMDLRWLGLDWDEGPDIGGPSEPYLQSERASFYAEALERLQTRELVYPCTCTRADIARAASAPHEGEEGPSYPGTCAGRRAADARALDNRPFAWRFRVPAGSIAWSDLLLGEQAIAPALLGGDFVVSRSTGEAAYQLAVVVDDAAMGVSQVIRGDDLVASTPRQLALYRALGLREPWFGHVPLVVDATGRRLAKRDQVIKLASLREAGVDPRKLIGWLARSCGWSGTLQPSAPLDWIEWFDLASLPRGTWMLTPERLSELLG